MSTTSELMTQALYQAQTQLNNFKKVTDQPLPEQIDIPAPVCAVGDTECTKRWVQAFGDCD